MTVEINEKDNERAIEISQTHGDRVIKKSKINPRSNSRYNENIDTTLEFTKSVFDENNQLPISNDTFKAIVENAQGKSDIKKLCVQYNIEPSILLNILELRRPYMKNSSRSIKTRFEKLSN
ncbi:unnamed protein product [Macrosiphum euphorbiae]|uniref:Uncharacterized protein n=1 Tax=Macrosiphum euphorbiae TaxID=13131 RepID=A0AAV0W2T7_9HEMI|nr:unnamed protein product [Macrosiphum euphorbiae]